MAMIERMKIAARLRAGFGLLLALVLMMAGFAAWQMRELSDDAEYYAVNLVPSYVVQKDILSAMADMRTKAYRHVLSNSEADMDALEAAMAEDHSRVSQDLDRYAKDLISDDEDRKGLERTKAAVLAYEAQWEQVKPLSRASAHDPSATAKANALMTGPAAQAFMSFQGALNDWFAYNVKLADQQTATAKSGYANGKLALLVLAVFALAVGTGAAVVLTRSIVAPLQQAVDVANNVAAGNLSQRIDVHGQDEVSQLLRALSTMNQGLATIVQQVRQSSDSILTGSSEIANGNADLSQRTEQQASNLQQTAASMEEINSTVRNNADTARQANQLATAASQAAQHGGEVVGQVVSTMNDITASSRKISDIITVIDGIAFQTNILALNAAVEAARAGEQGRGFAVVASEVRSLAQRSAEAAKEIKSLIGASVEKVEIGSRLVGEAGSSMDGIVSQVQRVADLIGEISAASLEQTTGIGQVSHAVTQLDQVTQQNAALVEESAAAAESLKHQAAQLSQAVSVFRV